MRKGALAAGLGFVTIVAVGMGVARGQESAGEKSPGPPAPAVAESEPIAEKTPQEGSIVEDSKRLPRPRGGMLVTVDYPPTSREKPFFEKLSPGEAEPLNAEGQEYSMLGKVGTYVGWFGIVRKMEKNEAENRTTLLVEMKYFDGMTDSHLQIVSFYGGGDFEAVLPGIGHPIKLLNLVRVYGQIESEANKIPRVKAEYVRNWDWGLFAFMTYGQQRGNAEWQKLNKIDISSIVNRMYSSSPNAWYYVERLGPRQ